MGLNGAFKHTYGNTERFQTGTSLAQNGNGEFHFRLLMKIKMK